jgi:hypothetical protein
VRLLRSSALNFCSKSIEFLPSNFDTDRTFADMVEEANFGDSTKDAAQELDDIFTYLKNSFSDRSDYLRILVKVFKSI